MKAITSDANPRFRAWLKLATQPRAVREQGRTLAEGLHLAAATLNAGIEPQAVLLRRGFDREALRDVLTRLSHTPAPLFELSAPLFDRLSPVEHGVGLMLVFPVAEPALPESVDADLVYLDGVQDPGNAGALLRVAAAAGVRHVCASPSTVALWAPKVLRGAQGAHFALRLHEHVTPAQITRLGAVRWIATAAHQAQSLWNVELPRGPVGWMFGSEGRGLSPEAEALCTLRVTIPIDPAVESLNVAASAAVCLFERRRRLDTGH